MTAIDKEDLTGRLLSPTLGRAGTPGTAKAAILFPRREERGKRKEKRGEKEKGKRGEKSMQGFPSRFITLSIQTLQLPLHAPPRASHWPSERYHIVWRHPS